MIYKNKLVPFTKRVYVLDVVNKLCLKVKVGSDLKVILITHRLDSRDLIKMNRAEFEWFTSGTTPPQDKFGELRVSYIAPLTEKNTGKGAVCLERKEACITVPNEVWYKLKQILEDVTRNYDVLYPVICTTEVETPILDKDILRELLLSCASRHYRNSLNYTCKLCNTYHATDDFDQMCLPYFSLDDFFLVNHCSCLPKHCGGCERQNYEHTQKTASESLDTFTDNIVASLLLCLGLGKLQFSVTEIIGHRREEMLNTIISDRWYRPISDRLIELYSARQLKFYL